MALQSSDVTVISRGGTLYKSPMSDFLAYIQANVGTSEYTAANITARNALGGLSYGDKVMVTDATGDTTVTAGWALYMYMGASTWRKIAEQESLDVVFNAVTNLSYTASATQGIVVSDTGTDATIPAANATNAGLMVPAQFNKLSFVSVTAATDLDAIRSASHGAVTTAGTASDNPITVNGSQQLSFSIAGLASAP